MNSITLIENIELKIKQLVLKIERLEKENLILKNENEKQKVALDFEKETSNTLNKKVLDSQTAMASRKKEDNEQSAQLKQQMNQYIEEIDKCIEWLHNN